jgi:hypothetical protein
VSLLPTAIALIGSNSQPPAGYSLENLESSLAGLLSN